MRWQWPVMTFVALVMAGVVPARAQTPGDKGSDRARPFSLHVGFGSHLKDGGDLESLSFGYTGWRTVTLLVNVERNHIPVRRRSFEGGGSVTRGGTLLSAAGEVRYTAPLPSRVSPFVMAGLGGGVSRPNVDETFPDAVTNTVTMAYAGGGVRIRVHPPVDLFGDLAADLLVDGPVRSILNRDVHECLLTS